METREFHRAWHGLGVLGLVLALGCQGPVAPQAGGHNETTVTIAPTADRSVAQTREWATGDRLRTGSGANLGYGYHRGGLLPYASDHGGLFLADPFAATLYQVPAIPPDANFPILSGGGRFVVYERAGDLEVLDLATQLIQTYPQLSSRRRGAAVRDFDVDAFGNIAYVDDTGYVNLFDPRTGENFRVAASRGLLSVGAGYPIGNLALSGNGQFVTYAAMEAGGPAVYVTDVTTGRQYTMPFVSGRHGGYVDVFQMSPAGDQLLFDDNGRVKLLDLRTGFIDNLPLLNSAAYPVFDAGFADAAGSVVLFEQAGRIMAYDRLTGLVDTMPIANRAADLATFNRWGRFNYGRL